MSHYHRALDELGRVFDALDDGQVDDAVSRIAKARHIVVLGCGRERLQIMGFAMRLFHMGRDVAVAGDMTTPPLGEGDLLLATSGPGELASINALIQVAQDAGAEVLLITAQPASRAAALADVVLTLPAQTMANDERQQEPVLPMGSAYEGALFVLFEVMVLKLLDRLGMTFDDMRANHTNLE